MVPLIETGQNMNLGLTYDSKTRMFILHCQRDRDTHEIRGDLSDETNRVDPQFGSKYFQELISSSIEYKARFCALLHTHF